MILCIGLYLEQLIRQVFELITKKRFILHGFEINVKTG